MARMRACTSATVGGTRSGDRSEPAPLTLQGFAGTRPSSKAAFRMARRRRYAHRAVPAFSLASAAFQSLTIGVVILRMAAVPKAGRRWHLSSDRYWSSVRGAASVAFQFIHDSA